LQQTKAAFGWLFCFSWLPQEQQVKKVRPVTTAQERAGAPIREVTPLWLAMPSDQWCACLKAVMQNPDKENIQRQEAPMRCC